MPGLSDLRAAVADLKNKAGSGRVYFYAAGDHSGQLKHGFIGVEGGGPAMSNTVRNRWMRRLPTSCGCRS